MIISSAVFCWQNGDNHLSGVSGFLFLVKLRKFFRLWQDCVFYNRNKSFRENNEKLDASLIASCLSVFLLYLSFCHSFVIFLSFSHSFHLVFDSFYLSFFLSIFFSIISYIFFFLFFFLSFSHFLFSFLLKSIFLS